MTKRRNAFKNRIWAGMAGICLVAGGFFIGLGLEAFITWEDNPLVRDIQAMERAAVREEGQNQIILEAMENVTVQKSVFFQNAGAKGDIRIANAPESPFSMTVTLLDDQGGSRLYESDMIDPGYYIESVYLEKRLEAGSYSCTVLFQFYEPEGDLFAGEAAEKIVVIIEK